MTRNNERYLPLAACTDYTLLDLQRRFVPHVRENEAVYIPPQSESRVKIPARLRYGPARKIFTDPRFSGGVRTHHFETNRILESGENPIITTGTASGKSLIFQTEALHATLSNPKARANIFYPTRALNADQMYKWQELLKLLGLPETYVAAIDGATPVGERLSLLRQARIILSTPDVWQSWFMANLDQPEIQRFIAGLRLKVLEEVQLYSGAFGSSMMFLLRRIQQAQQWLNPGYKPQVHNRMIATSATIADAPAFMKKLTGQNFVEIAEDKNGAARNPRLILREYWGQYDAVQFCHKILEESPGKKILVFADSRAGVEEIAEKLGDLAVPYKSGMSRDFQRAVEIDIRSGRKKIVVATSALEVGIDLDFDIAINMGLPANLGSALQRIGRVGRHGPGLFIFADPMGMLQEYGGSLENYLKSELQTQVLYPGNKFIQMAQAMCLRRERRMLVESLPAEKRGALDYKAVTWPRGFSDAMDQIKQPREDWPWHFRTLLPPHGNSPHRFHSLRNIGGISWRLTRWDNIRKEFFENLGSTTAQSAFMEFQPGAIVRHQKKRWRVKRWSADRWGTPIIQMEEYDGANTTKHRIVRFGQANASGDNLISPRVRAGIATAEEPDVPFIGECRFRLHMGIYGFNENYRLPDGEVRTRYIPYLDDEDLAKKDPDNFDGVTVDYGPKRRMLIDTTGIVFHMPHWRFGDDAREAMATALVREYCEFHNIDASDIGHISERCRFIDRTGKPRDSHNMMIFDRTAGSLRLSQHLQQNLPFLLQRIIRREMAAPARKLTQIEGMRREYLLETARWFLDQIRELSIRQAAAYDKKVAEAEAKVEKIESTLPEGFIRVMAPGSRAEWVRQGIAQRVRIVEPKIYDGCPAYEVLTIDRWAFFRRARARSMQKHGVLGMESMENPHFLASEFKSIHASRAVPDRDLILTAGRWIGFNPQTRQYLELRNSGNYEDISIAVEEQMAAMREKLRILRERAREQRKAEGILPGGKIIPKKRKPMSRAQRLVARKKAAQMGSKPV